MWANLLAKPVTKLLAKTVSNRPNPNTWPIYQFALYTVQKPMTHNPHSPTTDAFLSSSRQHRLLSPSSSSIPPAGLPPSLPPCLPPHRATKRRGRHDSVSQARGAERPRSCVRSRSGSASSLPPRVAVVIRPALPDRQWGPFPVRPPSLPFSGELPPCEATKAGCSRGAPARSLAEQAKPCPYGPSTTGDGDFAFSKRDDANMRRDSSLPQNACSICVFRLTVFLRPICTVKDAFCV